MVIDLVRVGSRMKAFKKRQHFIDGNYRPKKSPFDFIKYYENEEEYERDMRREEEERKNKKKKKGKKVVEEEEIEEVKGKEEEKIEGGESVKGRGKDDSVFVKLNKGFEEDKDSPRLGLEEQKTISNKKPRIKKKIVPNNTKKVVPIVDNQFINPIESPKKIKTKKMISRRKVSNPLSIENDSKTDAGSVSMGGFNKESIQNLPKPKSHIFDQWEGKNYEPDLPAKNPKQEAKTNHKNVIKRRESPSRRHPAGSQGIENKNNRPVEPSSPIRPAPTSQDMLSSMKAAMQKRQANKNRAENNKNKIASLMDHPIAKLHKKNEDL